MKSHLKQIDYIEMHLDRLLEAVEILQSTNTKLKEENKSLKEVLSKVKNEMENQNSKNSISKNTERGEDLILIKKELNGYVKELEDCIEIIEKAKF